MNENDELFDVYVSYASADEEWVKRELLPRLEQERLRIALDEIDARIGAPEMKNVARLVTQSSRVLIVLTPNWLANRLNSFGTLLAQTADPDASQRKVLPVLLKDCELPESIQWLNLSVGDFRQEKNYKREFRRLIRDVVIAAPVEFPPRRGNLGTREQWQKWLHRNRKRVRKWALTTVAVWLVASLVFGLFPFFSRLGWQTVGYVDTPVAIRLMRVKATLFASTPTDSDSCQTSDTGLWRSDDNGAHWSAVSVPALVFKLPTQPCVRAAMWDFAYTRAAPERVYAATSHVGVLRSDTAGQTWSRVGQSGMTPLVENELNFVAVAPQNPDVVLVAAGKPGIYRSLDGGVRWARLDGEATCKTPQTLGDRRIESLPGTMIAGALMATSDAWFVGTKKDENQMYPNANDGLYMSRDNGDCWERVEDAQSRYGYVKLQPINDGKEGIAMLVRDYAVVQDRDSYFVWQFMPTTRTRVEPAVYRSNVDTHALYVEDRAPNNWYVVNVLGAGYCGAFAGDSPACPANALAGLICVLSCQIDFASDIKSGPPVMLMMQLIPTVSRILRLGEGYWLHHWLP